MEVTAAEPPKSTCHQALASAFVWVTAAEPPKSTCHQALASAFVWVTEPSKKLPSVLPSTAPAAPVVAYPASVLLWVAVLPSATLELPTARLFSENDAESAPTVAVTV